MAWADLAAEVATEVALLAAARAELAGHAAARAEAYRFTDPARLAASLPGLAEVGAPAVTAIVGRAARFRTGRQFRSFTGLAPRASETGQTDRKGQPMSKAGNRLLRTTLIRAADNARRHDPQLAKIYWVQMVERGAEHLKACCVVAAHLAERLHAVLVRGSYPTSSATPTALPSTRPPPNRSSPNTGPCPARSAPAAAAANPNPAAGRGRPLSMSSPDMTGQTPEGSTDEATFPAPHPARGRHNRATPEPRRRGASNGQGHRPARTFPCPGPAGTRGSTTGAAGPAGAHSVVEARGAGPYQRPAAAP